MIISIAHTLTIVAQPPPQRLSSESLVSARMHRYLYKSWQTIQVMIEKFFLLLPQLILGTVVFVIFVLLARGVRWLVERFSRRYQYARNLGLVTGRLAQAVVLVFGLLVAATVVAPSFHTADLIKVLGIGGIAIGFAFRDILQNFMAGIILLLHEPFRLGDQIKIDDFEGTVEAIESRATIIKTYDARRVVIPNSEVFTKSLTVNTAYDSRRAEHIVGIGYSDDIETVKRLILDALMKVEGVLPDPPPDALATELADFSVQILVRYWVSPPEHQKMLQIQDRVIPAIKETLNQAGIDMPYPTSQILFHDQSEETDGDRSRQREGWPAQEGKAPRARSIALVIDKSLARDRSRENGKERDAA